MTPFKSLELTTALDATRRAAKITTTIYADLVEAAAKAGREPVTIADYASQVIINATLRQAFPEDGIMGEEHGDDFQKVLSEEQRAQVIKFASQGLERELSEDEVMDILTPPESTSGRTWIIDPIDGTKGFLAKRTYAIAIALLHKKELIFGILGCPNLSLENIGELSDDGVIFYASRDKGAYRVGLHDDIHKSMRVSDDNADDPLHVVTSFESGHSNQDLFNTVVNGLPSTDKQSTGLDGQGKYGLVADGRVTCYFRLVPEPDYREKVWDHAAGTIIVEEAGGRVTDFSGKMLKFHKGRKLTKNRGIVVSNGIIHEALLDAIAKTNWKEETS